jgi:hypothetical protein
VTLLKRLEEWLCKNHDSDRVGGKISFGTAKARVQVLHSLFAWVARTPAIGHLLCDLPALLCNVSGASKNGIISIALIIII